MGDIVDEGWKTLNEAWKFSKRTVLSTPEIEIKVEEATSNEEWGPTTSQLSEIAAASFRYSDLPLIMATLYRRIQDTGKNWRHPFKSTVVMEYLLKHGSDDAIRSLRAHTMEIQQLLHFHHIDEDHKDVGQAVRNKTKFVLELLHDEAKLREEREKAKKNRNKYQGYGSESTGFNRGWDDDYNRNPYHNRREDPPSPVPSYRNTRTPKHESDSDDDSGNDSDSGERPGRGSTLGAPIRVKVRPRAPSDEEERKASSTKSAVAPPKKQPINLVDFDDPPAQVNTSSPFFPPSAGGGSTFTPFAPSGGTTPPFEAFPPSSGGGASQSVLSLTSPTPLQPTPNSAPAQPPAEEWDAFVSFETPKDQKDIWYQHKSLFDLQHLNISDAKNAPAKPDESHKKPLGAVVADKQKNKPPSAPSTATFAPFGPTATPPTLGGPTVPPQLGGATVPVVPAYPSAPYMGQPPMVGVPLPGGYPATAYPYAVTPQGVPVVYPTAPLGAYPTPLQGYKAK